MDGGWRPLAEMLSVLLVADGSLRRLARVSEYLCGWALPVCDAACWRAFDVCVLRSDRADECERQPCGMGRGR